MPRRVVITGIGAITPIGMGREELWDGLRAQRSAVGPVTRFDPSPFRTHIAAEVNDFEPARLSWIPSAPAARPLRAVLHRRGRMALDDAGLELATRGPRPRRRADGLRARRRRLRRGAVRPISRAGHARGGPDARAGRVRRRRELQHRHRARLHGPNSTNAMSCASGTIAIGEALAADPRRRRRRHARRRRRGAAGAALLRRLRDHPRHVHAQRRPGARLPPLRPRARRLRDGRGRCVLVLEERERAQARGARIYAEVAGLRHHQRRAPHDRAAPRRRAGRPRHAPRARRRAASGRSEIDYVNAHGSSTPLNDPTETQAIKGVLGEHAYRIPVSGTKGYHAHASAPPAPSRRRSAPSRLDRRLDPAHPQPRPPARRLRPRLRPRARPRRSAPRPLSNSFGFGGINAAWCQCGMAKFTFRNARALVWHTLSGLPETPNFAPLFFLLLGVQDHEFHCAAFCCGVCRHLRALSSSAAGRSVGSALLAPRIRASFFEHSALAHGF